MDSGGRWTVSVMIEDEYGAVDAYLRPTGAPPTWSCYKFVISGPRVPVGQVAWAGSTHAVITKGPRNGQCKWDLKSEWHRQGVIPIEKFLGLSTTADDIEALEMEDGP